jgi:hypothetical protein
MPEPVISLDRLLAAYVTPVLSAAGFRKSGRTYRYRSHQDDYAIINFQAYSAPKPRIRFFVNAAIVPKPHWDWVRHLHGETKYGKPGEESGLWRDRMSPPADVEDPAGHPFRSQAWYFDDGEGASRCGEHLGNMLRGELVPFLMRMLDRDELLAFVRDPNTPPQVHLGYIAELALLVDADRPEDLSDVLSRAELLGDTQMAAWVRARSSRRGIN